MKLKTLKIQNFRGYKKEISIDIDNLTVFVGKNDIGKSTVLEALDIFFNDSKGIVKIDKEDINKTALKEGDNNIIISAIFTDLPEKIIIDSTHETTFSKEYLLNKNGDLEIIKKYPNAGNAKVFIKSNHPTNEKCKDLLLKKLADYKKIIIENKIQCENQSINSIMRKSIWDHFSNELQLQEIEIDASKEDAKNIWDKIREYIPIYSLFQSDRKNSDSDNEVQDPLKEAVKQILKDGDIKEKFEYISKKVSNSLLEVSKSTLEKIKEMDKTIGEIVRTPENDDDRKLLISEKEEKIKNKTAKIDDYKLLLILYSPVKNPDNINFKRISQKLIENFPDYPEGYLIMTDFIYHNYPNNYSEILNYAQKGIEAYKNVDTKKYPEFVYENSRNHPMNELFTIMIDVYLKKGEKEKVLDVFNKNKKIIKYWMPPANYAQLVKKLGVQW